jgi:hypothetical protein
MEKTRGHELRENSLRYAFLSVVAACTVGLASPAHAAAAPKVWVVSSDGTRTTDIVTALLANSGYEAALGVGQLDALQTIGAYVILVNDNLNGGDLGDGNIVRGGAVTLTAYYRCSKTVDLFIGTLHSGYHGAGPAYNVGPRVTNAIRDLWAQEIHQTLQSEAWSNVLSICKAAIREKSNHPS